MGGEALARVRLMQLVSPALPIGGFNYSQGMEWAVEAGWVRDGDSLREWLSGLQDDALAHLDVPVLARLYAASEGNDREAVLRWSRALVAARETAELRAEERNRGAALVALLSNLGVIDDPAWRDALGTCQAAGFARAAVAWHIGLEQAALGYCWAWLENQVAAGLRLIPLGQTAGQRVALDLAGRLPAVVARGLALGDDEIGAGSPALAIASARHETQYTRLFRS